MATILPTEIPLCDPETEGVLFGPIWVDPRSNPLSQPPRDAPGAYLILPECQELVDQVLADLGSDVRQVPVSWSRAENQHGRCRRHADGFTFEIAVSKKVFAAVPVAERAETLVHEACHVVALLRGDHGHGPTWAACMRKCGREPQIYAGPVEKLNAYVECAACQRRHGISTNAVGPFQRGEAPARCRGCGAALTPEMLHVPANVAKRAVKADARRVQYQCPCGAVFALPPKAQAEPERFRCVTCRAFLDRQHIVPAGTRVAVPPPREPVPYQCPQCQAAYALPPIVADKIKDSSTRGRFACKACKAELSPAGLRRQNPAWTSEEEDRGMVHEREHTDAIARRIARDHLRERPDYYQRLDECMGGDERVNPRDNPKRMTAGFPGRCPECGEGIARGDPIWYDGKAHHVACWEEAQEQVKARTATAPAAGGGVAPPAGPRIYRRGEYILAESEYADKKLMHDAGLRWGKVPGVWALDARWLPKASIAELTAMLRYADASLADEVRAILAKAQTAVAGSRKAETAFQPPAPVGLDYYPYQKAGIEFALQRDATLIGDDMGLGKTVQAIGVCNTDTSIQSVVVVCPASLKINWAREFMRWTTRPAHVRVMDSHGVAREYGVPGGIAVDIVNYDILGKYTAPEQIGLLVVDEAQYIKNMSTQRAKGVGALRPRAKRCLLLTGTPLPNQPIELWNLLNTLQPGKWMKRRSFAERYNGATQGRYGLELGPGTHLDELQERMRREVLVRRLKSQVLTELPPKVRQIIPIQAKVKQTKDMVAAVQMIEDLWAAVEAAAELGTPEEYAAAMATFASGGKVAFEDMSQYRHTLAMAKVEQVGQFVHEMLESGVPKIVVFAHHHDVEDALVQALAAYEPVLVRGGESIEARQAAVDTFQTGSARVFIGGIMAAGVGLTLTAASHVIMAELDWVPANVQQCEDRCHRIGQKDTVNVYHLVVEGTLDITMANILVKKMEVADQALDKESTRDVDAELDAAEARAAVARGALTVSARTQQAVHRMQEEKLRTFTPAELEAIGTGLMVLTGLDPDRARGRNDVGWNKFDGQWGHQLADKFQAGALSQREANTAYKMLRKYARTQLPGDVVQVLYPEAARKNPDPWMWR